MIDYDELWDEYSVEFCKKLEYKYKGNWDKLDETEREIAALWKLVVDMNNGGFEQFFCNWGFDCCWYAMRGIQKMGYTELLELLHNTYMDVFDKFKNDKRPASYPDIPQYFTEEDEKILKETNYGFWGETCTALCKRAYEFYHDELKASVK